VSVDPTSAREGAGDQGMGPTEVMVRQPVTLAVCFHTAKTPS
jgi:hypothetical protein